MSKRLSVAVALLFAASLHAGGFSQNQDFRPATAEELAMKGVESSPGAAAAILDWVRVDDDNESLSSEYTRIKVFTDDGKKYADIEIPYMSAYPVNGRVSDISARTIRPDGKIVPFDGKVYDKVLYKAGGATLRAKTFTLADVQPGSILEYRFVRRWSDTLLLNTRWSVQYEIPMLRAMLTMRPYRARRSEFSSFFTYFGLPAGKKPEMTPQHVYELKLENIPPFQSEAFAPPEEQLRAWVNFYYTTSRVRPEEFWANEANGWTKRIEDFLARRNDAGYVAHLIGASPRETALKIYRHVQSMRNYSFETSKSEQELDRQSINASKNVGAVLASKAGFSEELNRAFVALARAAGLQADVVRVAPRDTFFFAHKLPDAEQVSAEVAVVTIDGQRLFLDPGTPHAPFGTLSWEKSNVPGFRVSKGATPEWLTTPQSAPADAVIKRAADLKMNGETLEGTVVVTYTGQEALVRRLRHLADNDAERKEAFEDEAKEWFAAGASVKLTNLAGTSAFDEPLVATFTVSLDNVVASAGSRTVVPMSVFAAKAANPFAPATRTHPIYFPYPRTEEDEVKLTVPESLRISAVPPASDLKAGALGYFSETKAEGSAVTYKRSMFVNAMLIDAKHYGPLRNFYSSMLTADQKPLLLVAKE